MGSEMCIRDRTGAASVRGRRRSLNDAPAQRLVPRQRLGFASAAGMSAGAGAGASARGGDATPSCVVLQLSAGWCDAPGGKAAATLANEPALDARLVGTGLLALEISARARTASAMQIVGASGARAHVQLAALAQAPVAATAR